MSLFKRVQVIGVIVGIVVGAIVSLWCLTYNWDEYDEYTFTFPKKTTVCSTKYMAISRYGGQKDIAVYQSSGAKKTKYTFYYKKRTSSKWKKIRTETFKKNGESNTHCIGAYRGAGFNDVKLKAKKLNNTSKYSKIKGYMGVCH